MLDNSSTLIFCPILMEVIRTKTRGRPKKDEGKNNQYRLRISDKELDMLTTLSVATEKSKADVLRDALSFYYKVVTKEY